MNVVFVTRRADHKLNNNPLIQQVLPEDYNIFNHLLKRGKSKISSPISYKDWYLLSHDIETQGNKLLLSAFCDEDEEVLVIDNTSVQNQEIFTTEILKRCFFIAHNADFEARYGVQYNFLPARYGCTLVNGKTLLRGEKGYKFDLVSEINRHLGYKAIPEWMDKDIREEFSTCTYFEDYHILYNAADTIRLKQLYLAQLQQASALNQLFLHNSINSRIIIPIAKAEVTGIKHDTEKWLQLAEDRKIKAAEICKELDQIIEKIPGIEIGKINPQVRKQQESQAKRLQRNQKRRVKLEAQLKQLEEKGKQHLKSYQKQQEQYEKLNKITQDGSSNITELTLVNWASPKQVLEVFRQMGIPAPQAKDNKTHQLKDKVSKEARANWFVNNPDSLYIDFMTKFDKFKKIEHNIKSFGVKWVEQYVRNGRAYTSLDQAGTDTGRFSSGSKGTKNKIYYNSQQVPKEVDKDTKEAVYRQCFIADDDRIIHTADYENCEGAVMTSLGRDLNMMKILSIPDSHSYLGTKCWRNIYKDRYNKHSREEDRILSETYEMNKSTVEKAKERDVFKNSGGLFPVAYGVFASKVAATSKIPVHEGQIMIDTIKAEIPDVIKFLDSKSEMAIKTGYVLHNTRAGSRRGFTSILNQIKYGYKASKSELTEAQSASRNSPIQGTNSELVKEAIAMIEMYCNIFKVDLRLLLTIHDELVVDSPIEIQEQAAGIIKQLMIRAANNYLIPEVRMGVDLRTEKYWKK